MDFAVATEENGSSAFVHRIDNSSRCPSVPVVVRASSGSAADTRRCRNQRPVQRTDCVSIGLR